jgi:hypothetical protein
LDKPDSSVLVLNIVPLILEFTFHAQVMDFRQSIAAEGRVEEWMTAVLLEMRRTNRLITKESVFYYTHEKTR